DRKAERSPPTPGLAVQDLEACHRLYVRLFLSWINTTIGLSFLTISRHNGGKDEQHPNVDYIKDSIVRFVFLLFFALISMIATLPITAMAAPAMMDDDRQMASYSDVEKVGF